MKRFTSLSYSGGREAVSDLVLVLLLAMALGIATSVSGEVVFQDFFAQAAGSVTNSVPWVDVEGSGWQSGASASQLALDGSGHLYNAAASAEAAAGVQLVPIGPHGSLTVSATVQLPKGSTEWVGIGFANSNLFLSATGSGSGPWLQVQGNGSMTLFGGAGLNNPTTVPNAFTNLGNPVQLFLTCDAFHQTASAGTLSAGTTNLVFNQWPLSNSAGAIAPRYFIVQMSTNLTTATSRWATAVSVDWLPRPSPMLTLPVPVQQTNFVGSPGSNDVSLIQSAFNLVSGAALATEIRFTADATYVISNASLVAGVPIVLLRATNVFVNGNGCKILITNPRIGFLSVNNCSNVIVQGFAVDHDPLPFTQGVVTHNFYTSNDIPKESAIEFAVDAHYPAPTNANYLDPNASRWGMVMDSTRPGRIADDAWTQVFYTNVVQTNVNGAFKVYLTSAARAQTVQPGDLWCMISLSTSAAYLDNQFLNSAFHGIYCRANNMLIAHNSVGGMGKNAICAFPAITANFLNFFVPTNVVILDNVLSDEGFSNEAVQNVIPTGQPAYAMIALHKADVASDYVTNGFEISGIRILNNAFLNWRRAPLTLHNATDVNIIGNYFGPPVTADRLAPLTNDVIADFWASDYPNLRFTNNANATTLADTQTISQDGTNTVIANAFQPLTAPRLTASLAGSNVVVSWVSPVPGFVLQQLDSLAGGISQWVDAMNAPVLAGGSNLVAVPLSPGVTTQFYRARQR